MNNLKVPSLILWLTAQAFCLPSHNVARRCCRRELACATRLLSKPCCGGMLPPYRLAAMGTEGCGIWEVEAGEALGEEVVRCIGSSAATA